MPPMVLSREGAIRGLASLRDQLGRADQKRLDSLADLIGPDGRIRLSEALQRTFPEQPREMALTLFRQLRARLNATAAEVGLAFGLEADRQTRAEPKERWCWFRGQDSAADAAARRTGNETLGVTRTQQNAQEWDISGKRPVRYFLCYAHEDRKVKDDLLGRLQHFFGSAKEYRFLGWEDGDIELGSDWHDQIQRAIIGCDFGLLLISPAFLASSYIGSNELPHFIAAQPFHSFSDKRAAAVALKSIRFDGTMDLKGLERKHIFQNKESKAYGSLTGQHKKDDFTNQLFGKLAAMLAKNLPDELQRDYAIVSEPPEQSARVFYRSLRKNLDIDLADIHFVRTQGHASTHDKLDADFATGERRDALEFLTDWAISPKGRPYCALLGEYGMGKTTTSMAFAQALLEAREARPSGNAMPVPLPIYLDLRHLGEGAKAEPGLLQIVETVLQRSWRGGQAESPITADEVVRLVQEEGAIAIFDGLDEVLVHLSPAAGQRFTREIFRILPPALSPRRRAPDTDGRPGRVLVTCRTHYFRTLREQKTHFTAQDRDDVRAGDYRVFVLLPFTEEQIRTYLEQSLPSEDIDRVVETIGAVHNLPELAERPFTLSLIAQQIPQIKRWKLEGRQVSGIDLYRHMVLSWLERDSGKHQLTPDHKRQIMEYFAASLWRSGKRAWSVAQVEQWLIDFMRARPALAAHYDGKDRELLKEDLRTATFLVREGEANFRFAHTSLQEFFLAGYLHRALTEGRLEDWDLPRPSPETLDFLGQLLVVAPDEAALETLRMMRKSYRPRVSELAFAFILLAQNKGYPAPSAAGFSLDGADLRQWTIAGRRDGPPLSLRGASFRQARMTGASLRDIDLDKANFSGAELTQAQVVNCRAGETIFAGADLTASIFRDVTLEKSDFFQARFYHSQFLKCRLASTTGLKVDPPSALFALCEPRGQFSSAPIRTARLAVLDGHTSAVNGCAFSPDGAQIASVSNDHTVRIWDTASGECVAELNGHQGIVRGCAFSPDGRRVASTSDDRTVRVWDVASGACLAELHGHQSWVRACAFSPDGSRIASASDDRTARIWDAASGKSLLELHGHQAGVKGCAFSPDGVRLVSTSDDWTVRVWQVASGECIAELSGRQSAVTSGAFSPDGAWIASASIDRTVRIWDAASYECVADLRGHEGAVMGCMFSPDGRRLVSASYDQTVRLWDWAAGDCVAVLRGHEGAVTSCTFSPNGERVASASNDGTVRIWEAASKNCMITLRGHRGPLWGCTFSPDGSNVASVTRGQTLRMWDTTSGKCKVELRAFSKGLSGWAISPDGLRVASGADRTIHIWDVTSGECVAGLHGHQDRVMSCAFSPDGSRVASASFDGTVRIWDVVSSKCVAELRGHKESALHCTFSPIGAWVASASTDRTARIWDVVSGQCVSRLEGHESGVLECTFSRDGARLASASIDQTVRVWDVVSGECLAQLRGHKDRVMACAFSPNGEWVASASSDRTVRIWDWQSGKCVAELHGHQEVVSGCAFSPSGAVVASASYDGTLRMWDLALMKETGLRWQSFDDGSWASLDLARNRIIQVSGDAWRWLGWLTHDETGTITRYPAEAFGPLPEFKPRPVAKPATGIPKSSAA